MRKSWDEHFLLGAKWASEMATCPRRSVGAVIVNNRRVISTGHNGAPANMDHCLDVGCLLIDGHCRRSIHAEINAVLYADRKDTGGSTIYVSGACPCIDCAKIIIQAGIYRVVTDTSIQDYSNVGTEGINLLTNCGIEFSVILDKPVLFPHNINRMTPSDVFKTLRNLGV